MATHEIELLPLFNKFIEESRNGIRLKKDGTKLKPDSVNNYVGVEKNLINFVALTGFHLRLRRHDKLDRRAREAERNYWKRFYKNFCDYLFYTKKCHDNYVGSHIRIIRAFFNYLKIEKLISTGNFYKEFYITQEEVPIITLSKEQLQFLIFDKKFKESLPAYLHCTLDIFIIGCTVALRISDLLSLKFSDVEKIDGFFYLKNQSQKTLTFTRVRLPDYAVIILEGFRLKRTKKEKIFPMICKTLFNKNLKTIAEIAGWTNSVGKSRSKRGKPGEIYNMRKTIYRFCDLMSSHIMRRTSITTMLILGMPDSLVRKVSGHSCNSRSFFRYINYSQAFLDTEINKVHEQLKPSKSLKPVAYVIN